MYTPQQKNNNVVRKGTNTSPIILGPTYLHWDGSYATYCDFLSKIRSVLGYSFPSEKIVFGTDEEIAMVNAIKTTFPQSKHILCIRHLEENAKRDFQKLGFLQNTELLKQLFGKSGILTVENRMMFIEKQQEIVEKFGSLGGKYLTEKLLPILFRHVFLPRLDAPTIHLHWKNNNCESMNNKIKLLGNWHISKVPQLIDRLKEIEETQMVDIRGSFHGRGNFELAPTAMQLRVTHNKWMEMNGNERNRQFDKFLMAKSSTIKPDDNVKAILREGDNVHVPGESLDVCSATKLLELLNRRNCTAKGRKTIKIPPPFNPIAKINLLPHKLNLKQPTLKTFLSFRDSRFNV